MALSAVRNWFARPMPPAAEALRLTSRVEPVLTMTAVVEPALTTAAAPPLVPPPPPLPWTQGRLLTADALWGEGYQFPGGEIETLRLAKPLGLSKASSLLLVGAGSGGASCSLARQFGVWVSGFEADPDLAAAAIDRIAHKNMTRHAQIDIWDPAKPIFRERFYHHGLVLEALRGSQQERILSAIAMSLKPSGQLAMLELVADKPLDSANPVVATWANLERRDPRALPSEVGITRILGRLGFDVRITEDLSQRHISHALAGWRTVVRAMEDVPPTRREAMRSVKEAELWLLRLRLFESGSLRLVRWHAIGGG